MRPISQEVYGIPRDRVIGSGVALTWKDDGHSGTILRQPQTDVVDRRAGQARTDLEPNRPTTCHRGRKQQR